MMQPLSCYINHLSSGWVRADHTRSVVWMSASCCAATLDGSSAERQARASQSEQHYFIKEPLAGVKHSALRRVWLPWREARRLTSTPPGHHGNFTPSNPEPINGAAARGLPVSCLGLFNAAACNVPHLVQFPVRAAPVLVKANVLCLFIAHRRHQVYCSVLALPSLSDRRNGPDFARQRGKCEASCGYMVNKIFPCLCLVAR